MQWHEMKYGRFEQKIAEAYSFSAKHSPLMFSEHNARTRHAEDWTGCNLDQ